jgi:tetratricopeptide (TPR) repeat protein
MASDFAIERQEAERNWKLSQLLQDLQTIKTSALSTVEEYCLYSLLCRYNLGSITLKLGWTSVNALRTELSNGLYTYIKHLLHRDTIRGARIADWLEPEYGKRQLLLNYDVINALISHGESRMKTGNYQEAISAFRVVLDMDQSCLDVFNKIAECFYQMGAHDDALEICSFLLYHTSKKESISNAFRLVELIYQENKLQYYSNAHAQRVMCFFHQAQELSAQHSLPAWNVLEPLLCMGTTDAQKALPRASDLLRIPGYPVSKHHHSEDDLVKAHGASDSKEWFWEVVFRALQQQ